MHILENEFNDQKDKINIYFSYLVQYDTNPNINITVSTTQKSSFILIMYNLIESTVTKLLSKIHENVLNGQFCYYDLNEDLRKMIFVYFNKIFDKQNINKYHLHLESFYSMINQGTKLSISYKEMIKMYPLFSGNLDAREIRAVLKNKYGFKIENELEEEILKKIREGRNTLAHGESSFEEYGRNLSISDIEKIKEKTFAFLEQLIQTVHEYFRKQLYTKYIYRKHIPKQNQNIIRTTPK